MSEYKCCKEVRMGGNSYFGNYKPCGRPAKMEHEGKHYCGMHDPVKRKTKQEERDARWKSEYAQRRAEEIREQAALSATAGLSTATLTALAEAGGVKRVLELLAKYHWYHVDCEEYMENHDPPTWVRDTGNILREMTELADTALLGKETPDGQ